MLDVVSTHSKPPPKAATEPATKCETGQAESGWRQAKRERSWTVRLRWGTVPVGQTVAS
jgi:hypothetical protein